MEWNGMEYNAMEGLPLQELASVAKNRNFQTGALIKSTIGTHSNML